VLSSNEEHICNFINREGNNDFISFSFIWQIRKISLQVPKILKKHHIPSLVVRSYEDFLSSWEKDKRLFSSTRSSHITLHLCRGYHALLNEKNNLELFIIIQKWILKELDK
jgi:hypothetical protein